MISLIEAVQNVWSGLDWFEWGYGYKSFPRPDEAEESRWLDPSG